MSICKGAFDTKSNSFAHDKKPPTKAQQYIYNRIPFAMDPHAYGVDYFKKRGLFIPSLDQIDRWQSKEYFDEINSFVDKNIQSQTIETISNSYLQFINQKIHKELRPIVYLHLLNL